MADPLIGPSGLPYWEKDPSAVKDYSIDWSAWLAGDTISTSTWTVPAGITKDSDTKTNTFTTIWLSGGALFSRYRLTNRIVTTGGRTEDRSIEIIVRNQ
jgi:hypothetical protein